MFEYDKSLTGVHSSVNKDVNALKRTSAAPQEIKEDPAEGTGVGKIRAQTDSTKLRDFLSNLGNE